MIDAGDRQRLLAVARAALEARVRRQPPPAVPRGGALDLHCGAFVTIHDRGGLRGCLGRLGDDQRLGDAVAHLGAAVAESDPRFPVVMPDELTTISIDISVLSPEEAVTSVEAIEVGRHGVIVEQGTRRGLLLPQVASEHGWDRETFLAQTCLKAGLLPDAWRHGTTILVFEAEVFGDDSSTHG
jgi:AmmeMemoRadiSam system protein A